MSKTYGQYEAEYHYEDGARSYQVFFHRIGERYWKRIGLIGHPDNTPEELNALMNARVTEYASAHSLSLAEHTMQIKASPSSDVSQPTPPAKERR